ncbi:MAG: hypothetical protein VB071_01685 [Lawsonibacter sp.]|nr:hypothetical protein [Lawsonibacter sp.]
MPDWRLEEHYGLSFPAQSPIITELALDSTQAVQIDMAETREIPIQVTDIKADTSTVQGTSMNSGVATFAVTQTADGLVGVITPVSEGEADLYVSSGEISSPSIHVTVTDSARIAAEEAAAKQAEEAAAAKQATAGTDTAKEEKVWIPQSGSKYHSNSSCSNMVDPTQVPLDTAIARGYTPCKRCH